MKVVIIPSENSVSINKKDGSPRTLVSVRITRRFLPIKDLKDVNAVHWTESEKGTIEYKTGLGKRAKKFEDFEFIQAVVEAHDKELRKNG